MYSNSNFDLIKTKTADKCMKDISLTEPKFLSSEEEVVQQFIQTLFLTRADSIPFETFGIDLESNLFEIPSRINASILFDNVVRAIQLNAPHIKIDFENSSCNINNNEYLLILSIITKSGKHISIKKSLGMNISK